MSPWGRPRGAIRAGVPLRQLLVSSPPHQGHLHYRSTRKQRVRPLGQRRTTQQGHPGAAPLADTILGLLRNVPGARLHGSRPPHTGHRGDRPSWRGRRTRPLGCPQDAQEQGQRIRGSGVPGAQAGRSGNTRRRAQAGHPACAEWGREERAQRKGARPRGHRCHRSPLEARRPWSQSAERDRNGHGAGPWGAGTGRVTGGTSLSRVLVKRVLLSIPAAR